MPKRKVDSTKMNPQDLKTWDAEPDSVYTAHPDDEQIDNVFADFPQNETCIELWRTSKVGGRPVFLEEITPAMFSFSFVADKFGGGMYIAKGRYKDGSRVRMPFEIEGESFTTRRVIPNPAISPSQNQPSYTQIDKEPYVVESSDGSPAMLQLVNSLIKRMDQSELQMLEKMKMYRDLFGGGGKVETPLDTALNMFQKGLEVASLNSGEGISPWLMIARELKDPLSKIVDTVQIALQAPRVNGAVQQASQAVQPVTQTPPNTTDAPVVGAVEGTPMNTSMKMFLHMVMPPLINGASKGSDPGLYVDFTLDQVPVSSYPELQAWLESPTCLDSLAAIEPGIRYQADWWATLRENLIRALKEESHVEPVQSTESGHVATEPATARREIN